MKDTKQQFEHVIEICRSLYEKKLHDYGAAWRIMRPSSVTDQIFIKANRIRSIEVKGVALIDEGIHCNSKLWYYRSDSARIRICRN